MTPLRLPPPRALAAHLGPFRLEAAWRLDSRYRDFGGYSALLVDLDGHFTAFSDRGTLLHFARPGDRAFAPLAGWTAPGVAGLEQYPDSESATGDPASGTLWTGWETANLIVRRDPQGRLASARPRGMAGWPSNKGPEAMVRLADGRFIVLCECFDGASRREHPGLLFAGDPVAGAASRPIRFAGVAHFRPVDMAQLPDGRVLVLMRRLVWPMPPRFAGAIVLADPARIAPDGTWRGARVAHLASTLGIDNFESMAIEPRGDRMLTVWLLSDDNAAVTQRTLLWKLAVDPARLR